MEPDERIRKLLVLGDNRLKQGDHRSFQGARESYEEALALARESGLEGQVAPLVDLRLAEVERLSRRSTA